MIFSQGGTTYKGQFKNGLKEGQGLYSWPDGAWYNGQFQGDRENGFGTYHFSNGNFSSSTVWSEGFLYKVAPPELKISPIMYFVIQNIENCCAIRAKFWKIWLLLYKIGYFDNNRHRQIGVKMAQRFSIFWITPLNCG